MKKLATTFGLLALMLVVTSFTSPNEIGGSRKPVETFEIGGSKKPVETFEIGGSKKPVVTFEIGGSRKPIETL
jgi:hypothetical protein